MGSNKLDTHFDTFKSRDWRWNNFFAQSKFRVADENLGHDGIVLNPPKSVTKLSMVTMFTFT